MSKRVITVTMNPSIDKTILLDKLNPYGLNRVKSFRLDPGGKGINVARVLRNFHVDTMVSGLIAGKLGEVLQNHLKEASIPADFMEVNGETRTNLKIVDQSVNKTTEVNETGFPVSGEQIEAFLKKLEGMTKQASILILGGSLPPGVPDDFYAKCTQMAKSAGAKVILDADGSALAKGIEAVPYAIKPNIHELENYFGESYDSFSGVADAAKKLITTGIEIVIISMGPDGAILADREHVFKADSWDIPVKSTVGAGDSMVGALAYSILRQDTLYDIARLTTAAGTVTASKSGTQVCTLEEVLQSLSNVTVRPI